MRQARTVLVEKDVAIPLRDGVTTYADVYRPAGETPVPVVVVRTPYDKEASMGAVGVLPGWLKLAERGYAVVVQDVRGRSSSEGVFYPFANEGLCAWQRLFQQLLCRRRARRPDGRDDAPAGSRNLLVRGALQSQREFMRSIARIHQMRVAFDETGRDPESACVRRLRGGPSQLIELLPRTDPRDPAIMDRERSVLDDADVVAVGIHRGQVGADPYPVPCRVQRMR